MFEMLSLVQAVATFSVYAATHWAGSQYGAIYLFLIIGKEHHAITHGVRLAIIPAEIQQACQGVEARLKLGFCRCLCRQGQDERCFLDLMCRLKTFPQVSCDVWHHAHLQMRFSKTLLHDRQYDNFASSFQLYISLLCT